MLRLPNLAIVSLCQFLPYWWVVRPALLQAGTIPVLTERTFGLLVLATVLTTLAGYIINDVFDYKKDLINRPGRTVLGRWLPPWVGVVLYGVVLGAALYAGVQLGRELPASARLLGWSWPYWVYPLVSALLFLYAWQLKCTALVGNLLVAALCAVVPALVLLPETRPLLLARTEGLAPAGVAAAVTLVWIYAMFAFATTLLREQIKTLQDFEGDAACDCATLPVRKGVRAARVPAIITGALVIIFVLLALVYWQQHGASPERLVAGTVLLLLPTIFATAALTAPPDKRTYRRASLLIKFVMLAGVFLLLPHLHMRLRQTVDFAETEIQGIMNQK